MSSSVPCNVPCVLKLIARNLFSKTDLSTFDFRAIAAGGPVPLPGFSILDVGCGFGKWGFLVRDTFDVMMGQHFSKPDWKISITGVEPFEPCITDIQRALYDDIVPCGIFEALPALGHFDLAILGDVIEHFEKAEAYDLLGRLFEHTENIIVSTPLGFMPQGAWAGNERETHKSGWEARDFEAFHVVEQQMVRDELVSDVLRWFPGIPDEMKEGIPILVVWLRA
jgi:SAM-dependent methyltransferase